MSQNNQSIQDSECGARLDETAVCDSCGSIGAYRFDDRFLCLDCYSGRSSCCPEFGKDDLWAYPPDESLCVRGRAQPVSTNTASIGLHSCAGPNWTSKEEEEI